jgi:hypothetical protein
MVPVPTWPAIIVKNGCGMLVGWLVAAAVFASVKDKKMIVVAVGGGFLQGIFYAVAKTAIPSVGSAAVYLFADAFDFATTALVLAWNQAAPGALNDARMPIDARATARLRAWRERA